MWKIPHRWCMDRLNDLGQTVACIIISPGIFTCHGYYKVSGIFRDGCSVTVKEKPASGKVSRQKSLFDRQVSKTG